LMETLSVIPDCRGFTPASIASIAFLRCKIKSVASSAKGWCQPLVRECRFFVN
jgi:hypothetical protein